MKASMKSFWKDRIFVWLFALTLIIIPPQGNPIPPYGFYPQLGFYLGRYVVPALFGVLLFEFVYRLSTLKRKT